MHSAADRGAALRNAVALARRTAGGAGQWLAGTIGVLRPRVRDVVHSTLPRVRVAAASATWLRNRHVWAATSLGLGLVVASYYSIHFTTMHRSRCLPISAVSLSPSIGKETPFVVLLDAPGAQSEGTNLDVYYDVCGLAPGTPYTTQVSVTRNGFLNKITGRSPEPVKATYNESAGSNAVRRHRTLDTDELPSGGYKLSIAITEADRVRKREIDFNIAR
jgi:hypothetical protein